MPLLARFIARRAVDADALDAVVAAHRQQRTCRHAQIDLLEGMRDGLEGRYDVSAPAGLGRPCTRG